MFNAPVQVLDDGRLTDGQGRTVDFKNTIIVLIVQPGIEILRRSRRVNRRRWCRAVVMTVVRHHFRPEFLNRLDEIILFRRLQRSDMASIVSIQLEHLRSCSPIGRSGWNLIGQGVGLAGARKATMKCMARVRSSG